MSRAADFVLPEMSFKHGGVHYPAELSLVWFKDRYWPAVRWLVFNQNEHGDSLWTASLVEALRNPSLHPEVRRSQRVPQRAQRGREWVSEYVVFCQTAFSLPRGWQRWYPLASVIFSIRGFFSPSCLSNQTIPAYVSDYCSILGPSLIDTFWRWWQGY